MLKVTAIVAFFSVFIVSCSTEEKPLTKEESVAFAKKIEISMGKRNGKVLDEAIDEKALFKKMDLASDKDSRAFKSGLKEGMTIGTKLVAALSTKGSYSFIKHYEKNNVHHLLFRIYDNGMMNYHDLELKRTNGEPRVADIYIYLNGESLSATLKNVYAQLKDEFKRSADESATWIGKMPEIRTLITAGKHNEALEIYNRMPDRIKKGRMFQVMHMEICSGLTSEEYTRAIAEYQTLYPNEPNMQLLMIDGYVLRKDYEKALGAVEELDKMIDKDPLLDFHRAMCYTLLKNEPKRLEYLERLVKNLPDFEEGVLELIADYLESNEYEKAKPLIVKFKNNSDFDQSALTTLLYRYPDYNEKYNSK